MLIRAGAAAAEAQTGGNQNWDPALLRKASRGMRMALECASRCLPVVEEFGRDEVALIVGTSSGELDTSSEFLLTLSRSGLARPILFQNSLHNSLAGFLSINLQITGPSFTVSSGERTPGECVELTRLMLRGGECRAALVVLVETHRLIGELAFSEVPPEGAACLLFEAAAGPCASGGGTGESDLTTAGADYDMVREFAPLIDITASGFFKVAARLQL